MRLGDYVWRDSDGDGLQTNEADGTMFWHQETKRVCVWGPNAMWYC